MNTNMDNRRARIPQLGTLALSVVSVMGISIFIYVTIENIRRSYVVREFLSGIQAIVWYPYRNIRICALLLALLVGSMFARDRPFLDNNRVILFSLVADFATCFAIIIFLNFNYNGILLLVFSNVILYAKNGKPRYFLAAVTIGSFIPVDYELLSISCRLYSMQDYISFYNVSTQQYLLSCYNILVSPNVIILVVYRVNITNQQQGNLDEIHALNRQPQNVNEQLQEYSVMVKKMTETRERNCLVGEIHDTLGHTLTGIATGVDTCLVTIGTSPQQTEGQLELISKVTRDGAKEIRRSASQLRPNALGRLSLEYTISKVVSDMNVVSDARVYFDCQVKSLKFDEDEENTIYRVIQEGIINALRHGHTSQIWTTIKKEDMDILLQIRDNGIGYKGIKNGFGAKHMKKGIKMLSGVVIFDGSDGSTVNARIPVRWGEAYDWSTDCRRSGIDPPESADYAQ